MSTIASGNAIATVAALIGDPARANMLAALMGGQALTAGELAWHGGISASTASGHLAKLAESGLLTVEKQGRHRYYRLSSVDVAQAMEALMVLTGKGPKRHRPVGPRDEALRAARTCYDHLAGRLGIALTDALCARNHVHLADGVGVVTPEGERLFRDFGVDVTSGGAGQRPLCRACFDWSERRHHLAGRLGAGLLDRALALGWLARSPDSRAVTVTAEGERGFVDMFGVVDQWRGAR
ncbi:ArsR/SmtB family transcription factor [Azospirillum griseum]|uniref:Transcriptional regulator n=1 Tax=Azospirillum griseum TaxID=2496639 RepID=A0A431VIF0_9PROT|nr:helix-turn-helix transcriptional regulator [Azospirillum griseum]RTR20192.1 transcriptional regulator [Azospirillum griseum]